SSACLSTSIAWIAALAVATALVGRGALGADSPWPAAGSGAGGGVGRAPSMTVSEPLPGVKSAPSGCRLAASLSLRATRASSLLADHRLAGRRAPPPQAGRQRERRSHARLLSLAHGDLEEKVGG